MVFFSLVFAPCISADYRRVVKIKGGWSHGDGTLGPQCGVKGEGEWTTIPQAGWDKLFISFVPADSVKATAKTTKSNVRNGTCKWGDPIYETTRLLKDSKSKQYDEKLYKFVVAMGSSRSSILGEISINLADYADAMKPSIVALPLDGCDSGTVLHVAIQLLTSKTGFREFEQQRELRERGLQTGTDQNRHEGFGTGKVSSSVEFTNDQTDKVNARVRFRPESKDLPSLEEEVGLTEQYADSAAGFDGSSNTSESLCAEKHDTSSTHEIDSLKSMVSGDLNGLSHCQSPREEKGDTSDHRNLAQGSIDSVHGWSSDYSIDNDLAIAYEENNRLRGCLEVAESYILELKLEVSSLQSHADEIGIEARRLSQQFAAEIISGEELAKEVSVMKSECSTLKDDLEELKILKLSPQFASRKTSNSNQDIFISRLGGIAHFSAGLKQGTEETSCSLSLPSEMTNIKEISEINSRESKQFISGNGFDVDLYHPPDMLHCLSIPSIASQEPDLTGATELEQNQKQMLGELQNLRNEHSACLYTIATTSAEMESMHQDMNEQIIRFTEERRDLDSINRELERKAVTSEAALRRTRLNYSIAVNQLQKDLDFLSSQVLSMFATNENLIKQTVSETSQPCFLGNPDAARNPEESDARLYLKVEEELSEMHVANVHLDVFSKILQETLLEASAGIMLMKKKIDELTQKMDLSTASKKLLLLQLQTAMDDVQALNEYKASCMAKCSDMALQNQILEAQFEANSMRHDPGSMDFMGVIPQLEEFQHNACEKILQLLEEKKNLENERDLAQMSSSTASSELLVLKQNSEAEDKYAHQNEELSADLTLLEAELQQLTSKNVELAKEILGLDTLRNLEGKFKHDVQNMATKLEAVNGLVEKFQLELETLANKLHISSEAEEKYAHQNEEFSADLALLEVELQQLTLKNVDLAKEILGLDTLTEELGRSKLIIAELTGKRQDLMISLQDKTEESVKLSSELNNLKESLRFLHDELNVERSCRDKLEGTITDLTSQLNGKNDHLLQFSQQEAEPAHFRQLASDLLREQSGVFNILQQHEECLEKIREDSSRLTDLESQSSELHEYVIAADVKVISLELKENTNLVNTVDSLRSELKASVAQNGVVSDLNSIMAVQLEEYKKRVAELDLNFSNDKNEHSLEFSKPNWIELHADVTSLEESKDELLMLQNQCNELTHRLSEQILKTEEFKNLSIYLKELKDHAKAECLQARKKREHEGPQAYDRTTAELECALLSLECCKEEKQRLEDSLQECNEENNRIATELTLTKGQLESSESAMKIRKEESNGSDDVGYTSGDTILGKAYRENPVVGTSSIENRTLDTAGNGSTGRPFSNCSDQHSLMNSEEVEDASSIPTVEDEHSTAPAKMQPFKDAIVAESGHGISKHAFVEQWALLLNDSKHVAVINNQFKTRSLQFSMDHLHKELEKMKNENSLLPLADCHFEPIFQGFQTELMQLHKLVKVNEELRSIFPVFSEVSDGGNALERVLALEIELAEALQSKKKSSILFQSSFLRQHSDEQAIFQSFRDINELIKEMLELKGRYAGVESELKEMHDRYSQLSLQFAELLLGTTPRRQSVVYPPMPCLPSSRSHASPALDVNGTLHKD
ncbi:hypothetical protein Acr_04g0005470 [Actinidia rufa]|uniref:C2 NT-type domain-containing protein n=1 Tax=Actinidia rufa TaxID=165716 RepID=A0A7J0EIS1_9ERIC|nr:hypothetical protein Acr_04g0005470 [Actinidia rufa]